MISTIAGSIASLMYVISSTTTPLYTAEVPLNVDSVYIPVLEECMMSSGPVLHVGSEGAEIRTLQKILNIAQDTRVATSGPGSPGNESEYFGPRTQRAVTLFQEKYAPEILVPASVHSGTGVVGMYTRAKIHSMCNLIVTSHMTQDDFSLSARSVSVSNPKNVSVSKQKRTKSVSSVATPTTSSPSQPLPVSGSSIPADSSTPLVWGVFSGYSASDLTQFERLVGKPVQLKAVFTNWNSPFPTDAATGLKASRKTLVVFWEQHGVTLDSIIAGDSDAYIRSFATQAKSYGGEVILSPLHEMNGNWDPWGGTVGENTPEKVVQTWRHIHDVFGTVSNVKFAWAVNNESVPNTSANAIQKYYPGDTYTDYVAVDGFNFGSPWRSFDSLFASSLQTLETYKKPIYILSMASAQGPNKSAWITDALSTQIKKYPSLKGWVWFNENKERDWRVNSDTESLVSFKAVLPQ